MKMKEFKQWLSKKGVSDKVQSDYVSRIKRIEKELKPLLVDQEYEKDKCKSIIAIFDNRGFNKRMEKFHDITFPLGSSQMNSFRLVLNKYVEFREESGKFSK